MQCLDRIVCSTTEQNAPHVQAMEAGSSGVKEAWEDWDVRRSLFDNHMSASFEKNLSYTYKNFGFVLPDAPCLKDPEGLVRCGAALNLNVRARMQFRHAWNNEPRVRV